MPSTSLLTNIDDAVSPTTFNTVAGASIIVAIIVRIGKAAGVNPIRDRINISEKTIDVVDVETAKRINNEYQR